MSINIVTLPSNIGGISVPDAINGPLTALYGPGKFDKAQYRYPRDLGTNPARKHSIVFTVRKNQPKDLAAIGSNVSNLTTKTGELVGDLANVKANNILDGTVSVLANYGEGIAGDINAITNSFTRLNKIDGDTIGLYIPDTVQVAYRAAYDENFSTRNALGRPYFLAQGATSIARAWQGAGEKSLVNLVNAAGNDPFIREFVFGKAGQLLGMDLARLGLNAGGYAVNPQLQVLFSEVGFRHFQFVFTFIPHNKEEADTVKTIIEKFKYHSAPEIMSNGSIFEQGLYMKVPDSFNINFFYGNEENKNVHKVGECVLTNVDVNYAGGGQWSTFNDGSPTQINLTLDFTETVIIDKKRILQGY